MLFSNRPILIWQWGIEMQLSDRIGRRLKLNDLHVLAAVAQAGSMSKAAKLLNTTQPAISKSIADLEHAMRVRLLDRTTQGVEPTSYGRALLKRSIAVFDELKQSVEEIEFLADPTGGEIRIGTTEPLAAGIIPATIDRLNRQYPRISCHVDVHGDFSALENKLRAREIDLMIACNLDDPVSEDLNVEMLLADRLLLVTGPRNRLARRRKLELADLVNESWTLPPLGSAPRTVIVNAFHRAGIEPPKATVTGFSIPLHASLMATGRFIAALPESLLRLCVDVPVKVLPVDVQMDLKGVRIVTLKNRTQSPVTEAFASCARGVAKILSNRR
jgi:DNA-binding transcriptional LysR family regulator